MRLMILVMMVVLITSCERAAPPIAKTPSGPPTGKVTLDQTLHFADGDETFQGTGFLVTSPKGAIVGVTSAHYLDRTGPRLVSLEMTGAKAAVVAKYTRSLGLPGNEGLIGKKRVDLRTDYLLLWPDAAPNTAGIAVLTLDPRTVIPTDERVWLPYAGGFSLERKERLIGGHVTASEQGVSIVELDEDVELMGHSGSPIISQNTGHAIGTLSRGGSVEGKATILLAPSHAILKAMRDAEKAEIRPALQDNIGK